MTDRHDATYDVVMLRYIAPTTLGGIRMPGGSLSAEDEEFLLATNREVVEAESQLKIETIKGRLSSLPVGSTEQNRERIGETLIRAIMAELRPLAASETVSQPEALGRTACQVLERPVFSIQSPVEESRTTFSGANAAAGTLEFQARAGAINGIRYPSSNSDFLGMAYNHTSASIGAAVALPPHGLIPGYIATLEVTIELQIEQVWDTVPEPLPGSASHLQWVAKGGADLPLRGSAIAFSTVGLTLHGAAGSHSRTQVDLVSSWVNRDGGNLIDSAPEGVVKLSHSAVIPGGLVVAGIFVDATCHAIAEEFLADVNKIAYAELKCRGDDIAYPVPSRLRLIPERTELVFCERPLLAPPQ